MEISIAIKANKEAKQNKTKLMTYVYAKTFRVHCAYQSDNFNGV